MSDMVFFIKMFFITVFLVLAMQVQVGDQTMEWHAIRWVQTSPVVAPLNGVAQGGAKAIHDLTQKVYTAITRNRAGKVQQKVQKEEPKSQSIFRWDSIRKTQTEQPAPQDMEAFD